MTHWSVDCPQIERLTMDEQITYLRHTLAELTEQLGKADAGVLVSKSLVFIEIGSNDFINNYLLSTTNTSKVYTPSQFTSILIERLSSQLTVSWTFDCNLYCFESI